MIVGFTGTRRGLTGPQRSALKQTLWKMPLTEFHHGDCIGADDEAAGFADLAEKRPTIHAHPGLLESLRAHSVGNDVIHPPDAFFRRNRRIVDLCDTLLVCPADMRWESRGGTWMTHDYARKSERKVTVIVIWPDGVTTDSVEPGYQRGGSHGVRVQG